MTTQSDAHDIESAARQLIEGRVQSVSALADIGRRETALEEELAGVRSERARRYAAALKDGWTDAELSKLGLGKPGTRSRRRTPSRPAAARSAGGDAQA